MRILVLFFIFFISSNLKAQELSELLRQKIENSSNDLNAWDQKIYCQKGIVKFYQQRSYQPVWLEQENRIEILKVLGDAAKEGLSPQDYHYPLLKSIEGKSLTRSEKMNYDLLLTDAFILYASHISSGKVNPITADPQWFVNRKEVDVLHVLEDGIKNQNIKLSLTSLLPQYKEYHSLKLALKQLYEIEQLGGWGAVSEETTLKIGMNNLRVETLKKRLYATGYFDNNSINSVFDEQLETAIKKFQIRHGLVADGAVGNATIKALNVPVNKRIEQLRLTMERWRWMPQDFGEHYLKINIANYELEVIKNNHIIKRAEVIVGKPYRQTPVFNSKITYLVLNPTWTVPPGILKADVLPAVKKNANYLKGKNIRVIGKDGKELEQSSIDWSSSIVKTYTYRQDPGELNALGEVKFMFPNSFSVYLHDTPSRELFDKQERAFSSGCIRVSKPLELAAYLLNDSVKWNLQQLQQIVKTKKTQTVQLPEPVDIYILYWTAWADERGNIHFRKDIYSRDPKMIEALNAVSSNR
jgi:murein L,D-transpeptidase YcbB/YkuD